MKSFNSILYRRTLNFKSQPFNLTKINKSGFCLNPKRFNTNSCPMTAKTETPQPQQQIEKVKPCSEIPSPPADWFLGHLRLAMKFPGKLHQLQEHLYNNYGDIVRITILGKDQIFLFDPSDIADVFRTNAKYPIRLVVDPWVMYRQERNLPIGIVSFQGEDWKRHRQVLNKMLLPPVIEAYVPRVGQVAKQLVHVIRNSIDNNGKLDKTKDILFNYSTEAVLGVLLGRKLNLLSLDKKPLPELELFIESVVKMFETSEKLLFSLPLWKYFNTSVRKQHYESWDTIFRIATQLMQESGIGTGTKSSKIDPNDFINDGVENFLEHIIHAEDKLSIDEINTTCVEMVAAGVDTTTNALMSTLYHIAQEPEIQERLYNELMEYIKQGKTSDAELESHPLLKNIVTESLRINPVVAANSRSFDYDIVIKGYRVPANSYLILANWVTSRSEKYFKDALKFNPDRHVNKQHHPFAALTFGSGARSCVGKRLALMEIQTALMYLVLNFKIENKGNFPNIISKMLLSPIVDESTKLYFHPRQNQFN
eukprot:TRINITY_DN6918_c0_g1_i1.p1 TRINITY_DN6918_c0_g1~~TRINITY_DN6918_c0_g1_i1.p1  ORF type:complete len:537 (+),score=219.24 TRINITY_DN6918_c0_g1_i1:85-1695(+)